MKTHVEIACNNNNMRNPSLHFISWGCACCYWQFLTTIMYVLTCDEIENLKEMYMMLYPTLQVSHLRRVCCKIQKVCVSREMISFAQGNTYCNSCISALWKPPSPSNSRHSSSPEIRIGHVQYILKHYITTEQGQMQHLVNWFKKHPQEMYFGSSCYVVRADVETGNVLFQFNDCFHNVALEM